MNKLVSHVLRLGFVALFTTAAALGQDAPAAQLPQGAKYVALGSSFAAGPGIDTQLGTCGRSDRNYPHIVAAALNLSLTDVSCSGATTANILDTPQADAAPQIEAVTSDTALVTVTIGGNDIRFTASTMACAGTAAEARCTANLDQAAIDEAVRQLPGRLVAVFDAIRNRAPEAIIVLVTYPRVFPPDAASCRELAMSPEDSAYLMALGQKLEDAFVAAAASRQILIADPYVGAEGHGPCAAAERWVNGNTVADSGGRFHPTAEGHVEMARLVLAALNSATDAATYSLDALQGAWWSACDAPAAEFYISGNTYSGDFEGSYDLTLNGDVLVFTRGLGAGHSVNVSGAALEFRIIDLTETSLVLRPMDSDSQDWTLHSCDDEQ